MAARYRYPRGRVEATDLVPALPHADVGLLHNLLGLVAAARDQAEGRVQPCVGVLVEGYEARCGFPHRGHLVARRGHRTTETAIVLLERLRDHLRYRLFLDDRGYFRSISASSPNTTARAA
jgi:hypothetical protein